ncbi:hypothetical protein SAMD00019534_072700 [Acytostelium subglobosum LB1]|uniref:hypothetical protein n=1 Tax=Acytostelium subglobosum LB1 TaxID=1410327 RepID=UPI000644A300|nr:hypothetical protein SAMD00019534_072700 [Acytostelium subglobosum LB1]GAM24095.1 hypothetical protein SAMD00019534_072700 [Acytostelium subglobosum LB1]|eukprot:XP_012753131.1 hypothetical protein SAMD00019534_072700 [Acytostelium subglobosum LB1]
MTTYNFNVEMSCGGCSKAINTVLSKLDGVSNIQIDVAKKSVVCDSSKLSAEELLTSIQKTGKKASIVA